MPSLERFKWIPMIVKAYNQALQQTRARAHAEAEAGEGGGSHREGTPNRLSLSRARATSRRGLAMAGTVSGESPRLNARTLRPGLTDNPSDNLPGRPRNPRNARSVRNLPDTGQSAMRRDLARRAASHRPRATGAAPSPQSAARAATPSKPVQTESARAPAPVAAPADVRALPPEPRRVRVSAADRTAALWRELRATRNALLQLEALQEELASAQADIRAQLQALLERLEHARSAEVGSGRHEAGSAAPASPAAPSGRSTPTSNGTPPLQRS